MLVMRKIKEILSKFITDNFQQIKAENKNLYKA